MGQLIYSGSNVRTRKSNKIVETSELNVRQIQLGLFGSKLL